MRTNRTGYLMAMLAGLAIVGASTGGVVAATSHHDTTVAAEQSASAAALESSAAGTSPLTPATPTTAAASPAPASSAPEPAAASSSPVSPAGSSPSRPSTTGPASSSPVAAGPTTSQTSAPAPSTSSKAPAPPARPTSAVALKFKNGRYSATGSYNSPGGTEKLGVTLTLASDKVVRSNLDLLGGAGLSHAFQTAFQSGYSAQVIGKDISSISLGAVSGSSLTGMGFNDALKQIESQARV